MRLILCCDPLDRGSPEPDYRVEADAAVAAGLTVDLMDFEALTDESDAAKAVRRVGPASERELGIYRGWMLKPTTYARLYEALEARGVTLINAPDAYRHCHYLPESYSIIEGHTPRSVWTRDRSIDAIVEVLRPFGSKPVIVKDFVKSARHDWNNACFIPRASDRAAVDRVVRTFLEWQFDLNEGLVFREFIEFECAGKYPTEHRLFFVDGDPILTLEHWGDGPDRRGEVSVSPAILDVGRRVRSRFFTMDVARRKGGDQMIVELGDGQVAGSPEASAVPDFFSAISSALVGGDLRSNLRTKEPEN